MPDDRPYLRSRGLVFFPRTTPRRLRRAKLAFAALAAAAAAALVWPLYPWFAGIRPMILGLPLSFAWVVAWLGVVFVALMALYRAEYRSPRRGGPSSPAGGGSDHGGEG